MGALPRPDLPPGSQRELNDALHDLHHRAGWPSLRTLAGRAGCSHTTVSAAFSSTKLPSWGTLELLVEAMDGDVAKFHHLWLAASTTDSTTPAPPLIAGRIDELATVRRHLETGSGLLLVVGEAGIGKTTLVTAAAEMADTFVATGHCLPLSTEIPLLPMVDGLRAVHDVDDGDWVRESLAACPGYVADSLGHLLPEVATAPTTSDREGEARPRLFSAVKAILDALGSARNLGIVVEDLHWADASTLDLLEHLLARPPHVPIIGTWRTADPATPDPVRAWRGRVQRLRSVRELDLAAMSREETAEQLAMLSGRQPSSELVDRIHGRSLGQPLFTEQLAAAGGEDHLPERLADLLDLRLVGLGDAAWRAARTLGVADRSLPDVILDDASGLTRDGLTRGLHELRDHHLLATATGARDVEFRHPLLAEAIRRRLVPGEDTEVHRGLAAALAASPDPAPAEVAAHWQRAGLLDEEVTWRIRAARAAAARHAAHEEADQWLRVLELYTSGHVSPDGPSLGDLCCAAIDATSNIGRTDESVALTELALNALDQLEGKPRADIYYRLGSQMRLVRSPEESLAFVDRAIEIYLQLPPVTELAMSLARRSDLYVALGRWDEAAADLATAADVCATTGDPTVLRDIRGQQAWLEAMLGNRREAFSRIAEAYALTCEPDPPGEIRLGVLATDVLLKCGGSAHEVVAAAAPGIAAARSWDAYQFAAAILLCNVSEALSRAGDVAGAAAFIDPASSASEADVVWSVQAERAFLDALRGRLDHAVERFSKLPDLPRRPGESRLYVTCVGANLELWRGDPDAALITLTEVLDDIADTDSSRFAGPALRLAARTACDRLEMLAPTSRPAARLVAIRRLRELRARMPVAPFGPGSVFADAAAGEASWQAETAALSGAPTVERWVAAANQWDKLTRPHEAAYCRWRAAQVADATGRATTATRLLRRAARDARQHVPLLAAIRATAGVPARA